MKSVYLVKNLRDHKSIHLLEKHFLAPSPSDGPAPCDHGVRHWAYGGKQNRLGCCPQGACERCVLNKHSDKCVTNTVITAVEGQNKVLCERPAGET